MSFEKVWVVKNLFSDDVSFKGYVKVVKICLVNFDVTIFNRLKIMRFLYVDGKFIKIIRFLIKLLPNFQLFWKNVFYQIWTLQAGN